MRYFHPAPPAEAIFDEPGVGAIRVLGEPKGISKENYKKLRQKVTQPHNVVIHDARALGLSQYSFDKNGLQFLKAPEPVDFLKKESVEEIYYPKVLDLVKQITGASRAFMISHLVRTENPVSLTEGYARFAHTDSSPAMVPGLRRKLVRNGMSELEAQSCGLCYCNFWVPIDRPAFKVCSSRLML